MSRKAARWLLEKALTLSDTVPVGKSFLKTRKYAAGMWFAALLALAALAPMPALSQATFSATGSGEYQFQSNVYDLPAGSPVPGTNDTRHGDQIATYSGGLATSYLWGPDSLALNVTGAEYRYDRLTELDHSDYSIDLGGKFALDGGGLTGHADINRTRAMVPFYTLIQRQQQLVQQTNQSESAGLSFLLSPDWRIAGDAHKSEVDAPVENAQGLSNSEYGAGLQLTYIRNAKLTGGVAASYTRGTYGGVDAALAAPYHQWTVGLTSTYTVSVRTIFTGTLGYTQRTSDSQLDKAGGVSGSLDYRRTLTGKTSIDLFINRNVVTNVTNSGSEVDTAAGGTLNYAATYRLTATAGYTWTNRFLPDQGTVIGTDRTDHQQYVSLGLNYQWLRWLSIRGYANYQTRTSDAANQQFNATIVGIQATATWHKP